MRTTLTRETQNLVLGARQSKWVAEQIGLTYPTMMRALNPYDQSRKLSVDEFFDILKALKSGYGKEDHITNCFDKIFNMLNSVKEK